MSKRLAIIFLITDSLAFPACSIVEPGQVYDREALKTATSFYVARPADAEGDVDKYIEAALSAHGLRATSGPAANSPPGRHMLVEYVDRWYWDLVMYLRSLDVWFRDSATRQLIAKGRFKQTPLHSFPDPQKKTREVVDSIFAAAEAVISAKKPG